MFAFPDGLRLCASFYQQQNQDEQQHRLKPPPMSLFSFTMAGSSSDGASDQKSYATCCLFYEELNLSSGNNGNDGTAAAAAAAARAEAISKCRVRTNDNNKASSQAGSSTGNSGSSSSSSGSGNDSDVTLWVPKCVILVSRWPFLRAWRQWLKELVHMATITRSRFPSLSSPRAASLLRELTASAYVDDSNSDSNNNDSLLSFRPEPWLAQLFHATPLPLAPHPFLLYGAGLPVLLPLPLSPRRKRRRLESDMSQPEHQVMALGSTVVGQKDAPGGVNEEFVCLRAAPPYGLPLLDLSLMPLFQCLSVDHVLDVLANLLLERKVAVLYGCEEQDEVVAYYAPCSTFCTTSQEFLYIS